MLDVGYWMDAGSVSDGGGGGGIDVCRCQRRGEERRGEEWSGVEWSGVMQVIDVFIFTVLNST